MLKRLSAFLIAVIVLFTFAACKKEDVKHKTGWNNPDEPTEATTAVEEETTAITEEKITDAAADSKDFVFSEEAALFVGSFNSEIYGKLNIYHQDDYFVLQDEYKDKEFIVFAEGYSPSKTDGKAQAIFDDMNFDGYTDFGVCYYKDAINSYYFCFIWDNTIRSFRYMLSLSNLANPDFDPVTKTITANERLTTTTLVEKIYNYRNGELNQLSAKNITEEPVTEGAEPVDAKLQVNSTGKSSTLIFNANENSHSKWVCIIEDENVVTLSSECYDEEASAYEFMLIPVSEGATTVFFRYVSVVTGEYIEEIIVNAITSESNMLTVIVP